MLSLVALALIALVAAQPFRGVFLSDNGATLSIFELDNADKLANRPIKLAGVADRLDAVDFRATDGALIGFKRVNPTTGAFFVVNPCTGAIAPLMTTVGAPTAVTLTGLALPPAGQIDIDVNPTRSGTFAASTASCRVRIVGAATNLAWNVCTNVVTAGIFATNVAEGTAAFAFNVAAVAYSNNVNNAGARSIATTTTLYTVDAGTDSLYIQDAATGTLSLVGAIGADVVTTAGLDIFTDVTRVPSNRLILKSGSRLYELNPANGAILDTANIHNSPVAGECALAIGRFSCAAAPSSSISSSSSDSSSSSSSDSSSSK